MEKTPPCEGFFHLKSIHNYEIHNKISNYENIIYYFNI